MIDVVVAVDVEYEAAVVEAVGELPDAAVVRRPADEVELIALAVGGTGHVVVLSRWFPGTDGDVVERLHAAGARIVGYGDEHVFARWGIEHTVPAGADAGQLGTAVRDCAASLVVPPRPTGPPAVRSREAAAPGTVVAMWGTGSSPGRSTLAVVTAHLLARTSGSTVLVDADTVSASLGPALGLLDDAPQVAALCRLAAAGAAGDPHAVAQRLSVLEPGFEVATGLARAERWPEIRAGVLCEVLEHLAARARHVIVDVSDRIDPDDPHADPHYDRHQATRAVLDAADHVVLVASADPLGLQRLVRLLESERVRALREAGGTGMTTVVNRVRASAAGSDAEARVRGVLSRFAGLEDLVLVPEDRGVVDAAVLRGRSPVETARRSELVRACEAALVPRLPGVQPSRSRREDLRRAPRQRGRMGT